MSYLDLAQRIRLRFDRRKVGAPTLNSQPGAHTGSTRQYIPGYSSSNIVYLDTAAGNDAWTGANPTNSPAGTGPFLTYSAAATAASTTKKIRVVNNGAALTSNITKPTEMTIGVSGTISGSLTAPVNTFTQAATPNYGTAIIYGGTWCDTLQKAVICGASDLRVSTDLDTWTTITSHPFGVESVRAVLWIPSERVAVAVSDARIATSTDLLTWTEVTTPASGYAIAYSETLGRAVVVGVSNGIFYSDDLTTWTAASFPRSDTSENFTSVTFDEHSGYFVTVGSGGRIYRSTDGINWVTATTTSFGTTQLWEVASHPSLTRIVAVGESGKIGYSDDGGDTWTQAATPSFGSSWVNALAYHPGVGKWVAAGVSGKIAYGDGDTWTQSATPSFGTTLINTLFYCEYLSKMCAGANSGKIGFSTAFSVTISAPVAGFTISTALYSGTIAAYNCSMGQFATTANLSLKSCRLTMSGSIVSSNTQQHSGTLVDGNFTMLCAPATQNAVCINSSTISGRLKILNSSQTGYEQIRDNIIEDGLYASYAVIVTSGNIRGARTNATCTRAVSFSDPVFVDTTDYKLQRVTNGDSQDSPLVNASAYYVNEQGQPRDFGAWSYDDSTLSYEYKRAFYLLKPKETGIRPEKQPAASADQGMDGTWDAVNEPSRATEYLTLQYGSGVPVDHITTQDLMESLTDLTCEISLDPDLSDPDSTIQVNGAHSVGDCVLTIDASTTIKAGMVLTIGSYKYYILYTYPSTSPTKLILHQALLSSVADNLVITPQEPASYGTYQYIPQSRQIPRPQSQETEYVNGAVFKFVRQYPQI